MTDSSVTAKKAALPMRWSIACALGAGTLAELLCFPIDSIKIWV